MKRTPHLTSGEFELIEILWELGEGSVRDVLDRIPAQRGLAYTTVMTVLDKMRRKGYLMARKRGKAFVYSPAINRGDALESVIDHLIQTYFNGSRPAFLEFAIHGAVRTSPVSVPSPEVESSSPLEEATMDASLL